ncbi:MAG: hypothetical protein K9N10_15405 [Deltaproteobacteria bacterium]|nr:hypothetical protein [Deltaproteobacteria bacterium]
MKRTKKGKAASPALLRELATLEGAAAARGIQVHYDRMEAAGLRLNGGLCTFNGEYHLFVEKRKSLFDKIEFLKEQLEKPLPRPGTEAFYQLEVDLTPQGNDENLEPGEIK